MTSAVRRLPPPVLAALLLVTAACGGGPEEPDAASRQGSGATTPAAAPAGGPQDGGSARGQISTQRRSRGAPAAQPAPGDLANFECARRGGVWSARGDITNSTKRPMVYTLTAVTVDGGTVAGADSARFVLKPDASTTFDLPGIARGPAEACMPRLVRAPR